MTKNTTITSWNELPLETSESSFPIISTPYTKLSLPMLLDRVRVPLDGSPPYVDLVKCSRNFEEKHDTSAPLQPGDVLLVGEHPIRWEAWGGEDFYETGLANKGGFRVVRRGRPWLLGSLPETWKKEHPLGLMPYQREWQPGEAFAEVFVVREEKSWKRKGRGEATIVEVRILATNERRAFTLDQVFMDALKVVGL
jgi:hypothetical protein